MTTITSLLLTACNRKDLQKVIQTGFMPYAIPRSKRLRHKKASQKLGVERKSWV